MKIGHPAGAEAELLSVGGSDTVAAVEREGLKRRSPHASASAAGIAIGFRYSETCHHDAISKSAEADMIRVEPNSRIVAAEIRIDCVAHHTRALGADKGAIVYRAWWP
jgi:hypothetical protein